MASARFYAGGAVVAAADASAHRMLVAGGVGLDSCELYDAAADRWSLQEARLPQAISCHAAPIAGGSAVLAVELNHPEKTHCALLDVRSTSSSWQLMASPESPKRSHAVVAVGEYSVVMLGGSEGLSNYTDTAQLYDARADRWSQRPEWCLPVPSIFHCAAVLE